MKEKNFQKMFDVDRLEYNLRISSLYLTAYELLKSSIVDRLVSFFSDFNYKDGKPVKTLEYKNELNKFDKNDKFRASCLWLHDMKALDMKDVTEILKIREHRNEIAHELAKFLIDDTQEIDINKFHSINNLLKKVDVWWIINFEMTIMPDFNINSEQGVNEVESGNMLLLEYLISKVKIS